MQPNGHPIQHGPQGDLWDTQWDMFMCLLGAISSLLFLGRWHDRQIRTLKAALR